MDYRPLNRRNKPPVPQLSGRVALGQPTRTLNLENAGKSPTPVPQLSGSTGKGGDDVKAYMARTKEERATEARLKREQASRRKKTIALQLELVEKGRTRALNVVGSRKPSEARPPWNGTFASRATESRTASRNTPPRVRRQAVFKPLTPQATVWREDARFPDALGTMAGGHEDSIIEYAYGRTLAASLVGSSQGGESLRGSVAASDATSVEPQLPPRPLSTSIDLTQASRSRSAASSKGSGQLSSKGAVDTGPSGGRGRLSGDTTAKRARIELLLDKLDVLAARAQSIASVDAPPPALAPPLRPEDVEDGSGLGEKSDSPRDTNEPPRVADIVHSPGTSAEAQEPASTDWATSNKFCIGPSVARPSAQDQTTAARTRAILASPPQPSLKPLLRPDSVQPAPASPPTRPSPPVARSDAPSHDSRSFRHQRVEQALESLAREAEEAFCAAMRSIDASPPRSPSPYQEPLCPGPRPMLTPRAAPSPYEDAAADALIGRYTQWRRADEASSIGAAARAVLEDSYGGLEVYGGSSAGLVDMVAHSVLDRAREAAEEETRTRQEAAEAIEAARRQAEADEAVALAEALRRREEEEEAEAEAAAAATTAAAAAAAVARAEAARQQVAEEADEAAPWHDEGEAFLDGPQSQREPCTPPRPEGSEMRLSPGSLQRQFLAELHLHETLVASQLQVRKAVAFLKEAGYAGTHKNGASVPR